MRGSVPLLRKRNKEIKKTARRNDLFDCGAHAELSREPTIQISQAIWCDKQGRKLWSRIFGLACRSTLEATFSFMQSCSSDCSGVVICFALHERSTELTKTRQAHAWLDTGAGGGPKSMKKQKAPNMTPYRLHNLDLSNFLCRHCKTCFLVPPGSQRAEGEAFPIHHVSSRRCAQGL